jgi:hypothetical protein
MDGLGSQGYLGKYWPEPILGRTLATSRVLLVAKSRSPDQWVLDAYIHRSKLYFEERSVPGGLHHAYQQNSHLLLLVDFSQRR